MFMVPVGCDGAGKAILVLASDDELWPPRRQIGRSGRGLKIGKIDTAAWAIGMGGTPILAIPREVAKKHLHVDFRAIFRCKAHDSIRSRASTETTFEPEYYKGVVR